MYRLPLPIGRYKVVCHLAIVHRAPNRWRPVKLQIRIEGSTRPVDELKPPADPRRPLRFEEVSIDDCELSLDVEGTSGNAIICGLEILPVTAE